MLKNKSFFSKTRRISIIITVFLALFILTSHTPDYFEISKNLDIFNSVYRELNVSYVDGTQPGKLMKTGIDAMLGSLDPYTVYYAENDIEDYRFMTTGEYAGIGASVLDMDGKVIISDPFEGFAAFKAGIRAGDQIIGVNGIDIRGKKSDDVGKLLKGTPGTNITLKLIKPGQSEAQVISVNREEIKTKAVPYFGMLPDNETGYIKLVSFTEVSAQQVKEALNALKTNGCKRLVLDLRGNLGGLLNHAVDIVNYFVERDQEIVYTKGRSPEWDKPYKTVFAPIDTKIPLAVLVDENSASASEIVSGSLQDLDRAVIIGKRTFGKGLVQQTKPIVYNAQVKITVAKYYIPSGRCVQALDYSNKSDDGRVEKIPDSLITAFKTKGGRIVYDGAGIMPDIKTESEKPEEVLMSLVNNHHIFNYATAYRLGHNEIAAPEEFKLTDAEYNDFLNFLKDKAFAYQTRQELELDEFKKGAEEDKGYEAIKPEMEALMNKIKNNKKDDLLEFKDEIKKFLEEEIVGRYNFEKGRIAYSLKHDADLNKALEILKDENKTKEILTKIEKPSKPFNANKKF
mgnify:CR=1 FL=1